ncbi:unnamed protein product [Arctogadus glacialis]
MLRNLPVLYLRASCGPGPPARCTEHRSPVAGTLPFLHDLRRLIHTYVQQLPRWSCPGSACAPMLRLEYCAHQRHTPGCDCKARFFVRCVGVADEAMRHRAPTATLGLPGALAPTSPAAGTSQPLTTRTSSPLRHHRAPQLRQYRYQEPITKPNLSRQGQTVHERRPRPALATPVAAGGQTRIVHPPPPPSARPDCPDTAPAPQPVRRQGHTCPLWLSSTLNTPTASYITYTLIPVLFPDCTRAFHRHPDVTRPARLHDATRGEVYDPTRPPIRRTPHRSRGGSTSARPRTFTVRTTSGALSCSPL